MRSSFRHIPLLVFLTIPILVTGGYGASVAGAWTVPAGRPPIAYDPSMSQFPNISFTGRTPAAKDWYEQGLALTSEERYGEALLAYERALSSNRSFLNAWYYAGDALFRLGRYSEALLAFGNATAVDSDFVDAYFYESLVYEKLGRPREQKDALRRGLEAADRRKAAEEAGVRRTAEPPEAVSQPVPPGTAILGAWIATGLWTMRRKKT